MKKIFENDTLIVFEGFYESNLFSSDTEYYLNELLQDSEHPETYEITGQNYKDYEKSVCELHADILMDILKENGFTIVKSIKYYGMWSPSYYNFYTDKIKLKVDFNLNELKKYCFKENKNDFNFYINKKYSSRSGFISFVDNYIKDFINTYNTDKTKKDTYIDIMLEYYFIRAIFENETAEKIYNDNLHDADTDYKQRIYEQLTDLQMEFMTVVEDNQKQAV